MIGKPPDLFKNKHRTYLDAMQRVWVSYDHENGELSLSVEVERPKVIPPHWWRHRLTVWICNLSGSGLVVLTLDWTDLHANIVRAFARPCPDAYRPRQKTPFVDVGDIIFSAGESEHTLPNEFADDPRFAPVDPRDDRRP